MDAQSVINWTVVDQLSWQYLRAPTLDRCSLSRRSSSSVYSTILSRGSISDSWYLLTAYSCVSGSLDSLIEYFIIIFYFLLLQKWEMWRFQKMSVLSSTLPIVSRNKKRFVSKVRSPIDYGSYGQRLQFSVLTVGTVCLNLQQRTLHGGPGKSDATKTHGHNSVKCWPIYSIFSLDDSLVNF